MSKAILILDKMPKSCSECPIYNRSEMLCCGGKVTVKEVNTIPSWCPSKPIPEPKDERVKIDYYSWELESIINAESRGYNNCLNEILGGENETNNI